MSLDWSKLLNPQRRKELEGSSESLGTGAGRKELERDYDRILFAAPTRRLADKTQVYPMEKNDSVRNRLTHSHEVSNLARSFGIKLAFEHAEIVFGSNHEALEVKRNVPALLAAIGLAHDLGNPPFGHQGEVAMQQWFKEKFTNASLDQDFSEFDGNAQTFRLLTKLQVLNDSYGLNLTIATLAALVKYPSVYGSDNKGGFKKYGVFKSEKEIIHNIWDHAGLREGTRHPLTYVVEACDDIAYSVIDAEDTVKKGYASFYDLMDHLEAQGADDPVILEVINKAKEKNQEYRKVEQLSSRELNDISMQMFRVIAISKMVSSATAVFVENIQKIMNCEISPGFELIAKSDCQKLCEATKKFDKQHGFSHKDVLRLELEGNNYIKTVMTIFWDAISNAENLKDKPFERYVYGEISENYRRVYESSNRGNYEKYQLLCDVVSGMTESFLVKKCNDLLKLKNARH